MNRYIGHESQLYGVEEVRLVGGRGDGMRLFQVRNGSGLEFTVSADRCADISRLSFGGDNFSYFASCGYVAPQYYDKDGIGFLKSFTAGFLTTCGLTCAGNPCVDEGEVLPCHGTVSNIPCEYITHWIENDEIHIKARVRDAALGLHKLLLEREYTVPLFGDELHITDRIVNIGSKETPLQVLYHFNIGYPLLDEDAVVKSNAVKIEPRNDHAAEGIDRCLQMEKPQRGFEEMCYYHTFRGEAEVSVFNPKLGKGLVMSYDPEELGFFTEWKMMGECDYVLGIEPANCQPDGRDVMRKKGLLEFLKPDEEKIYHISFKFVKE